MLDRKVAPRHAEINSFTLPSPEFYTLNSGIPLIVLRGVAQRIIKLELIFRAGKWFEPNKGVSYFTAQLLEKGTATKNSFEIADYFDGNGAYVEISPGFDFVSVSLFSLTDNIIQVLPLFLELVTSPVFPEDELALQKEIFNQNLKINNEKTSHVASKLIRQHLFGIFHPYGSSIESADANSLTREQLDLFFYDRFFLSDAFIVGSVDESLLKILQDKLSALPTESSRKSTPSFEIVQDVSPEYVERPNSIQTSLRLGKRTINRTHKAYPSMILLNHILGGYFGSRLMKNIREEKGLTYGIYSSISNLKNDAFFIIAADVNRVNKDLAMREIKNELDILCGQPIGVQELHTAKNHLLGSLQLEIANPFSVIEKIKTIHLYELDRDYYSNLFNNILDVSAGTLQNVANEHLADKVIEVAVG